MGCFTGRFLLEAKADGWNVAGTEISEPAVNFNLNKNNIKVHLHNLMDGLGQLEGNSYDVVTLFDVIEHVSDPKKYLQVIYSLLRPGGLLFIDTPNFNSITRYILGSDWSVFFPWHRFYFSKESMANILINTGFTVINLTSVDVRPFSKKNAYLKLLNEGLITERNVSSKSNYKEKLDLKKILKKTSDLLFRYLSNRNIVVGSKLITYAERPI